VKFGHCFLLLYFSDTIVFANQSIEAAQLVSFFVVFFSNEVSLELREKRNMFSVSTGYIVVRTICKHMSQSYPPHIEALVTH
jgi:hypothetical protein